MLSRNTVRNGRRSERGAELIEFAIVFPLFLLVVAAIVDFGFLFQKFEVITNAAREGARIAVLPNYSTTPPAAGQPSDVQSRVNQYLAASGLTACTTCTTVTPTTITLASGATITGIRVSVQYPHTFLFLGPIASMFGGSFGTITVGAGSTMRQEVPAS